MLQTFLKRRKTCRKVWEDRSPVMSPRKKPRHICQNSRRSRETQKSHRTTPIVRLSARPNYTPQNGRGTHLYAPKVTPPNNAKQQKDTWPWNIVFEMRNTSSHTIPHISQNTVQHKDPLGIPYREYQQHQKGSLLTPFHNLLTWGVRLRRLKPDLSELQVQLEQKFPPSMLSLGGKEKRRFFSSLRSLISQSHISRPVAKLKERSHLENKI